MKGRDPVIPIDFGDLLIAVAEDLDEIRLCVGCGADSTWAGLFLHDNGQVSVSAWCDATACEHDRVVMSADGVLAVPIDHLPSLRRGGGRVAEESEPDRVSPAPTGDAGSRERLDPLAATTTPSNCNVYVEQDPTHTSLSRPACTEHGLIMGGYTTHAIADVLALEHLEAEATS